MRFYCTYSFVSNCTQISTNGIISFGGPFLSVMPEEFGEDFIQHFDTLISPLWADFNPSQGEGRVFYRSTDSARDLDSILEVLVRFNAEIEGFRPTQAVVVTWYRVPTFSEGQDIVSQYNSLFFHCSWRFMHGRPLNYPNF